MNKNLLGFGMMRLPVKNGEPADIDFEKLNPMVDAFMEAGYNYFDTSYVYHNGKSEDMVIYPDRRKVCCDHKEIELTVKEYKILCLLVINHGRVLTYDWLYEKIWNEEPIGSVNNAIACHIYNLREKILKVLPQPRFWVCS